MRELKIRKVITQALSWNKRIFIPQKTKTKDEKDITKTLSFRNHSILKWSRILEFESGFLGVDLDLGVNFVGRYTSSASILMGSTFSVFYHFFLPE